MTDGDPLPIGAADRRGGGERRAGVERRRYNRRSTGQEVTPPYYEAFERIAAALEDIRDQLAERRDVTLPTDVQHAPPEPRPAGRRS